MRGLICLIAFMFAMIWTLSVDASCTAGRCGLFGRQPVRSVVRVVARKAANVRANSIERRACRVSMRRACGG